jgi:PKD repeat protein
MKRVLPALSFLVLSVLIVTGCSLLRTSPGVDFEASVTEGEAPLAVQFTPQTDGAPISYAWSFGDGRTSDEPNPVHVYTSQGIYTVMLTIEFAEGDSVTRIKKRLMTVDPGPQSKAPTVSFDLYWISQYWDPQAGYLIRRGTLDGSVAEEVASTSEPPTGLDVAEGRVYWVWTKPTGGVLESANLDGTDRQTLVQEDNRLGDVAVDAARGKVYWTSLPESPRSVYESGTWDGGIRRADLDGSNVETLIEYPAGPATYADRIAVDPIGGLLAWSVVGDDYEGAIRLALLSPFEPFSGDFVTGVGQPRGMTLNVFPGFGANSVYYTTGDELRRVSLWDGSESTILSGLDGPGGVAVDPIGYFIYIGAPRSILRVVTDGTDLETLFFDQQGVTSIVYPR